MKKEKKKERERETGISKKIDLIIGNCDEKHEQSDQADKGFENFGLIDWEPSIMTDENGEFNFTVPYIYPGTMKILIEGFSADGKLISEIKTLTK